MQKSPRCSVGIHVELLWIGPLQKLCSEINTSSRARHQSAEIQRNAPLSHARTSHARSTYSLDSPGVWSPFSTRSKALPNPPASRSRGCRTAAEPQTTARLAFRARLASRIPRALIGGWSYHEPYGDLDSTSWRTGGRPRSPAPTRAETGNRLRGLLLVRIRQRQTQEYAPRTRSGRTPYGGSHQAARGVRKTLADTPRQ